MSETGATTLLNKLGAGVRRIETARDPVGVRHGGPDFAAMLGQARRGTLETGLPVAADDSLGLELDDEQLERISIAVDRLASSGAQKALVLIDGLALEVDVEARRVTGTRDLEDGTPIVNIDAVARAPRRDGDVAPAPVRSERALDNSHLLKALARASRAHA